MRNKSSGILGVLAIAGALLAPLAKAQQNPVTKPGVKASTVIGLTESKKHEKGVLTIQDKNLHFAHGKASSDVVATSIEDVVTGKDSRAAVGNTMSILTYGVPYGGGRVVALFRTKFDTLTIKYRDTTGGLHGVIFALPKGTAEGLKTDLVAAGAHTSAPATSSTASSDGSAKKEKQP